jgi:hypothetical protein
MIDFSVFTTSSNRWVFSKKQSASSYVQNNLIN